MTKHISEKAATSDKIANFISKNKYILWGVLGILIVCTIIFAIVDKKITDTSIAYSEKTAEIEQDFQDWAAASEDDKLNMEIALLAEIDEVVSTGNTNILVEKALYIRGQFYNQKEDWENAYADFSKIVEISPDSYLASVSLYNAATAKENSGDLETALSILATLSITYATTSPIIPETLFNIGRINEVLNNNKAALESYNELAESYSSSSWTNLAKTRIIFLKASGVSL